MQYPTFKTRYDKPGREILPHRDPFLFLDTLISADETGCLGEYRYTAERNDFFKGHFPGAPVVPGVILVETMCQCAGAGVLVRDALGGKDREKNARFLLAAVDSARFRRPVAPGDLFTMVVENKRSRPPLLKFSVKGYVGGELAAECDVTCVLDTRNVV